MTRALYHSSCKKNGMIAFRETTIHDYWHSAIFRTHNLELAHKLTEFRFLNIVLQKYPSRWLLEKLLLITLKEYLYMCARIQNLLLLNVIHIQTIINNCFQKIVETKFSCKITNAIRLKYHVINAQFLGRV